MDRTRLDDLSTAASFSCVLALPVRSPWAFPFPSRSLLMRMQVESSVAPLIQFLIVSSTAHGSISQLRADSPDEALAIVVRVPTLVELDSQPSKTARSRRIDMGYRTLADCVDRPAVAPDAG